MLIRRREFNMGKTKGVPATKPANILKAEELGAQKGALVKTDDEYAAEEAQEGEKYEKWRSKHWASFLRDYRHDAQVIVGYPAKVRHAKAGLLGLNMKVTRDKWSVAQRKLYDVFCANHVSPLVMFIKLALGDKTAATEEGKNGIGCDRVIELLEMQGKTLPQKISEGRLLLGRPVKGKGAQTPTAAASAKAAADAVIQSAETTLKTASGNPIDLSKKPPIEAVTIMCQSTLNLAQCAIVAQVVATRFTKSEKLEEQILGQSIMLALKVFYKIEEEEDETNEQKPAAAAAG